MNGRMRNKPCKCGSGEKYKWCCLKKEERAEQRRRLVETITRKDFIGEPYRTCKGCKKNTSGVLLMAGGAEGYVRECTDPECAYREGYSLPPLKKKIIYLDQFLISNMAKALDPRSRNHVRTIAQPFWLEAFKRLDVLYMLNLIICPDSTFHHDESLLSGDPSHESLREVYEHFSNGHTFYDRNTILRFQVHQHMENYLNGVPDKLLQLVPENVMRGHLHNPHSWLERIKVTARMPPFPGEIEAIRSERDLQYQGLLSVFERWQQETGRDFSEWVQEEAHAFGKVTFNLHLKHLKKRAELPREYVAQYLRGENPHIDLNDILPPAATGLIDQMSIVLRGKGITDEKAVHTMMEYLNSKYVIDIPSIHISSLLFAGLARKAAHGQKNPPNKGTFTDVNAISSLLPYCDAMFIDDGMAALLRENPLNKEISRYGTKVFSPNTKEEFLAYLDEIHAEMDPKHLEIIQDMYSKTWVEPHLNLLTRKRERL